MSRKYSLFFIKREQYFWAGFCLILVTVKPHLVILPVIYLLLNFLRYEYRKGLLGLFTSGVLCLILLFLIRPTWILDLKVLLSIAPVNWLTPTIGGLLSYLRITEAGRYIVVILFPLALYLSLQKHLEMTQVIPFLVLLTVPFTFFGWSYDQCILLIPIAQMLGWLAESQQSVHKFVLFFLMGLILILNLVHRVVNSDDLYYLWVPVAWGLIYGLAWWLLKSREPHSRQSFSISAS